MGFPMMCNLISKSGFEVSVFDRNTEIMEKAKGVGATTVDTPQSAIDGSSYVVTMLPGNDHVLSTYTSLKDQTVNGQVWIDCSTVSPETSTKVAELAEEKGADFLDAPVSGGVGGATNGTLTFMVGGKASVLEKAKKDVFDHMGANILHCGDKVGSGEVAKLCNNLILAISMTAVSEALSLGIKLGVDPKVLSAIINTSSGRCWSSDTYNPCPGVLPNVPSSNDYQGGFATDLMLKDLRLALEAAKSCNSKVKLGEKTEEMYSEISSKGLGDKDFSVMFQSLNK